MSDRLAKEVMDAYRDLSPTGKVLASDILRALAEGTDPRHVIMAALWLPKSQREEMCKHFDKERAG